MSVLSCFNSKNHVLIATKAVWRVKRFLPDTDVIQILEWKNSLEETELAHKHTHRERITATSRAAGIEQLTKWGLHVNEALQRSCFSSAACVWDVTSQETMWKKRDFLLFFDYNKTHHINQHCFVFTQTQTHTFTLACSDCFWQRKPSTAQEMLSFNILSSLVASC